VVLGSEPGDFVMRATIVFGVSALRSGPPGFAL
jgi:hypothetical protein